MKNTATIELSDYQDNNEMTKSKRRHLIFPTSLDGLIENMSDRKNCTFSELVINVMNNHFARLEIEADAFGNIKSWGVMGEPTIEEQVLIDKNRLAKKDLKNKIKKSRGQD